MENECCKNCRYGFDFEELDFGTFGHCRRFPPVIFGDGDIDNPAVGEKTWCGEFAAIVAGTGK